MKEKSGRLHRWKRFCVPLDTITRANVNKRLVEEGM